MAMLSLTACLIILPLCRETKANRSTTSIDPASLLPSSSLLHPLDFQDDWQASEPIPIDIFYKVPVNGEGDLQRALERANDAAMLFAQRQKEMRRELQDKEYIRQQIGSRLSNARKTLSTARH